MKTGVIFSRSQVLNTSPDAIEAVCLQLQSTWERVPYLVEGERLNVEGRQIQGLAVAAAERCPNLAGCATGAMALGTGDPTEQYFKPIFRVHLVAAFRMKSE